MSILQQLLNLREAESKKSEKIEAYGVKGMKSTKWRKTFKNQAEFEKWFDKQDGDVEVQGQRPLDESTIMEAKKDFDQLIDIFLDHTGYSMEGRKGLATFARLVSILGYKDHNYSGQIDQHGSVGDITNFLEDNSGAFEAMIEFIKDHENGDWQSNLEEWAQEEGLLGDGNDQDDDEEDDVKESVQLDEKVFDEDKYIWYVWDKKQPSKPFERRGGAKQLERGMQFGLRPATSKAGTWRLIMKQKGPSIIFSIPQDEANALAKQALELK